MIMLTDFCILILYLPTLQVNLLVLTVFFFFFLVEMSGHSMNNIAVAAKLPQLCPTIYDPMNCRPPHSSVYGSLQAIILEWVAISFSRGSF